MDQPGEVGSRKIFENDKVIVWEFALEPGEETPVHTHQHDYLFYVLEGAPLQVFDADGNDLGTLQADTGGTFPLRLEGEELVSIDDKGLRAPRTHKARNAGSTPYRELLIEWK